MVETQGAAPAFKLGTVERQGRAFVGIVLRESVVVDLAAAHAAISTGATSTAAPTDMKDLIARYDTAAGAAGVRGRILEIVRAVGDTRPAYAYDVKALKILPPIMYPTNMLNVAVNYREHDIEMARNRAAGTPAPTAGNAPAGTVSAPGIWERRADDTRWNPFMFIKSAGAIVADGEDVRLPPGRTQIEWECELGVVIGKPASRVAEAQALDYVFGYTLENDMSDRGGRGDTRFGSDWLVTKNHDTFAPGARHHAQGVHQGRGQHGDEVLAQRPAAAGRHHGTDDPQRAGASRLRQQHPHAAARRRDCHRDAAGRRVGAQPADPAEGRRSYVVHYDADAD
jgi:2-keto-4-pentenoate hydratase/2-oxohepta-3-ene-1,7-dioic acid hydratase in catechol pathway